jgi:hypothetical protein
MATILALTPAAASLAGCATLPISHLAGDPGFVSRAGQLPVFGPSAATPPPKVRAQIGRVYSLSCHFRYAPLEGQAEAVEKLRIRALARGADGIVGLRMSLITNTRSPCWHGFEASGLAVRFDDGGAQ